MVSRAKLAVEYRRRKRQEWEAEMVAKHQRQVLDALGAARHQLLFDEFCDDPKHVAAKAVKVAIDNYAAVLTGNPTFFHASDGRNVMSGTRMEVAKQQSAGRRDDLGDAG